MIEIDGYQLDYPNDDVARRFKYWLQNNRAAEHEFITFAQHSLKNGEKLSGYAIVQFIRSRFGFAIANDYGPMLARLAIAKHPELCKLFTLKPTGWGKRRIKIPDLFD